MYDFHRTIADIFCCLPFCQGKDDQSSPAALNTFQLPVSTLSVNLPHHTVPHSSSEDINDDAKVLRRIFSSSSSIRGYQTAATTPAYVPTSRPSLDTDFRFGPPSPARKPPNKIGQLGNHIRQKISESRMSKASSKPESSHTNKVDVVDETGPASLGVSQSSAGLGELLASRNVSGGGYDSDAHTIVTPVVGSNAGTIKLSPAFVKRTLKGVEAPQSQRVGPKELQPRSCTPHESTALAINHGNASSSQFPSTPTRSSFVAALRLGKNESPSHALRRLSAGIATGTIKMPDTPELRALHIPGIDEVENDWRIAPPERTSSLSRGDQNAQKSIEHLVDRVSRAKQEAAGHQDEGTRSSLISELDPTLLDYLSRYAERHSTDETFDSSDEVTGTSDGKLQEFVSDRGTVSPKSELVANQSSRPDFSSLSSSDSDSIHLFNMRISQRLASQSQVPVLSPANSINASRKSLAVDGEFHVAGRSNGIVPDQPRFPAHIVAEHNRRPSDPQTRKLFEAVGGRNSLNRTWKTVTTFNTGETSSAARLPDTHEDASSFYHGDGNAGSRVPSPQILGESGKLSNPHSLAVGGRSVSTGLSARETSNSSQLPWTTRAPLWKHRRPLDSQMSSVDSWLGPGPDPMRGRSASMPQKRSSNQEPSPTPVPKTLQGTTDLAENTSEISLGHVLDRSNEKLTEIEVLDLETRRDEHLSEVEPQTLHVTQHPERWQPHPGSTGGVADYDNQGGSRDSRSKAQNPSSGDGPPRVGIKDCATSMWERAFRNARHEQADLSPKGFLAAPQFDRNGRPRGGRTSVSNASWEPSSGRASLSGAASRRSRSAGDLRRRLSAEVDESERMCSSRREPLPTQGPNDTVVDTDWRVWRSKTIQGKLKSKKKSILDLGLRFAGASLAPPTEGKGGGAIPGKEAFGTWSRFPSHTRGERNSTASTKDGVVGRDFPRHGWPGADDCAQSSRLQVPSKKSSSKMSMSTSNALKKLPFGMHQSLDKGKSKSMTLRSRKSLVVSPAGKLPNQKKGLLGKWRLICRSSSSEMRQYALNYGHRSSISLGDPVEYPELECLPGEGIFKETEMQRRTSVLDGSFASTPYELSEDTSRPHVGSEDGGETMADAADLARVYGECVGSLSALKSTTDVDVLSMNLSESLSVGPMKLNLPKHPGLRSFDIREGTSDFSKALAQEPKRIREELIGKLDRLDGTAEDVPAVPDKEQAFGNTKALGGTEQAELTALPSLDKGKRPSKDLRVPGGFED